jgi:nucleoside-diphosphate-sugar epimerase
LTRGGPASAAEIIRGDLDAMVERDEDMWKALRGARLFLTGATGFVGKWLLESFAHANERLELRARAVALSRDPAGFGALHPRLFAADGIEWWQGDVRDFVAAPGIFTHAIHAATDVARETMPLETFDVIAKGTSRVLDFCRERGVDDLLLVSSGAIYGRQPPDLALVEETFTGAPSTTSPESAYAQGKRAAEWLAVAHGAASGPAVRIARCFAFVGPYLPMDRRFAIASFIADRLVGRAVEVTGDGTPVRSYLHAADLARWLWTILLRGEPGAAYNVGSEEAIALGALARRIATMENGTLPVRLGAAPAAGRLPERYVPSTRKARMALGLEPTISLDTAISRTLAWARASG